MRLVERHRLSLVVMQFPCQLCQLQSNVSYILAVQEAVPVSCVVLYAGERRFDMLPQNLLDCAAIEQHCAAAVLHCLGKAESVQLLDTLGINTAAVNSIASCVCVFCMPYGKLHNVWVKIQPGGNKLGLTATLARSGSLCTADSAVLLLWLCELSW